MQTLVELNNQNGEKRQAIFSPCKLYRYSLLIRWDGAPLCQFIGLNPSTADAMKDDPTVRRCKGFAKRWGFGGIIMSNLFAYRATKPADLKRAAQPIGERGLFITAGAKEFAEQNDFHIWQDDIASGRTVAAWGADGAYLERDKAVCRMLTGLYCLGLTQSHAPRHPLYVRADAPPVHYEKSHAIIYDCSRTD